MEVFAALTAMGAAVQVAVKAVRQLDRGDTWPSWLWVVLSLVFGIGGVYLFDVEPVEFFQADNINEVLTGTAIAGLAGGWHNVLDALGSIAKKNTA